MELGNEQAGLGEGEPDSAAALVGRGRLAQALGRLQIVRSSGSLEGEIACTLRQDGRRPEKRKQPERR